MNTYTPAPVTVDGEAFSYEKHFNLMRAEKQDDGTYKEVMEKEDGAWKKFSKDEATFTMVLAEVKEGADVTECPFPDGAITSEKDGNTFMTKSVTRTSDAGERRETSGRLRSIGRAPTPISSRRICPARSSTALRIRARAIASS